MPQTKISMLVLLILTRMLLKFPDISFTHSQVTGIKEILFYKWKSF